MKHQIAKVLKKKLKAQALYALGADLCLSPTLS
jgi:hypothetical protein